MSMKTSEKPIPALTSPTEPMPTFAATVTAHHARNANANGSCGVHSDLSFPVAISITIPTAAIAVVTERMLKLWSAGRNSCGRMKMMNDEHERADERQSDLPREIGVRVDRLSPSARAREALRARPSRGGARSGGARPPKPSP